MSPDPATALFAFVLLSMVGGLFFWPERGLLWRWQKLRRLSLRVRMEDALKHIYKRGLRGQTATIESIAGTLNITVSETTILLTQMSERELIQSQEGRIDLTAAGTEAALHIIRAHRLWERYLADATGFEEAAWHGQAEHYEHALTAVEVAALDARLGHPTHDPHGDPIPSATGGLVHHGGQPLPSMPIDTPLRIVHLEDEPDVVFAQLMAEGLAPGQTVRIIEKIPQRIRFWAGNDEHRLAPVVAGNISVVEISETNGVPVLSGERLTALRTGESAQVVGISPACRGLERRRFFDLGILPGTQVSSEMVSPGGDPTAYRIRGALIALRREQADLIHITRATEVQS